VRIVMTFAARRAGGTGWFIPARETFIAEIVRGKGLFCFRRRDRRRKEDR